MAKKTVATVEAPADDEIPVAQVIRTLTEYIRTGDPEKALERLQFAADEAARTVRLAGFGKVGTITLLVLAGECAGIGRLRAEHIVGAAFRGVPR